MSTANNSTQSVPYGSGHVYATLIRKADGTPVEPPQPLHIEGLQEATWDDKGTLKSSHGEGKYAVRLYPTWGRLLLPLVQPSPLSRFRHSAPW